MTPTPMETEVSAETEKGTDDSPREEGNDVLVPLKTLIQSGSDDTRPEEGLVGAGDQRSYGLLAPPLRTPTGLIRRVYYSQARKDE